MFTITINAKSPDEFREAVKALYALFPDAPKKGKADAKAEVKQPASGVPTIGATTENPVPPVVTPAAASGISIEAVRLAVQEKTTANEENKAVIKGLLAKYNAANVTKLDPANYADFLTQVKAIA